MYLAAITGKPIVHLLKGIAGKLNPGQEIQQKISYPSHFLTDAKPVGETLHTKIGVYPNALLTLKRPEQNPDILELRLQTTAAVPHHYGMNIQTKEGATADSLETDSHYVAGSPNDPVVKMQRPEDQDLLEREITGSLTQHNLETIYWGLD